MNESQFELATLGGGCFWCLEAVFVELQGVTNVESGYAGGRMANPSYMLVCAGMTGHAEVIQITFDPAIVSFREILEVFFAIHDPTTLNRQGADVGTQYRSAIFFHSDSQRETAQAVIGQLSQDGVFDSPIVTEVAPYTEFYIAEEYHQHYFERNPYQPYCLAVVSPKVAKLRKKFADKLKNRHV